MLIDRLLDVAWEHVKAAGKNHILLAVYQRDEAVLVEEADIAGVESTPAEGFFSRLRLLPVPLHDLWSTEADFAFLSNRQHPFTSFQIDNLQDRVRRRHSDAAQPNWLVQHLKRSQRRGLGEPISLFGSMAGESFEPLQHFHCQGRPARDPPS